MLVAWTGAKARHVLLNERLGQFLGQIDADGLSSVRLEFDGRAAGLNEGPVLAASLAGLLGAKMDSVNMVNATAVASANGLAVATVRHDRRCDYETLLRFVKVQSSEKYVNAEVILVRKKNWILPS